MDLSVLEAEYLMSIGSGTNKAPPPLDLTEEAQNPSEDPVVSLWTSTSAYTAAHVSLRGLLDGDGTSKSTIGSPVRKAAMGFSISATLDDDAPLSPNLAQIMQDADDHPSKFTLPESISKPQFTQWEPGTKA